VLHDWVLRLTASFYAFVKVWGINESLTKSVVLLHFSVFIMAISSKSTAVSEERIDEVSLSNVFSFHKAFSSIWPYRVVRIILASIFLWSGAVKLLDPISFAAIIEAYGLIPESWIMPVAICLPSLEAITSARCWIFVGA